MKRIYKNEEFNKIIIISGDGDYKKLIDFLVEENGFKKYSFQIKSLLLPCIIILVQNFLIGWKMKI